MTTDTTDTANTTTAVSKDDKNVFKEKNSEPKDEEIISGDKKVADVKTFEAEGKENFSDDKKIVEKEAIEPEGKSPSGTSADNVKVDDDGEEKKRESPTPAQEGASKKTKDSGDHDILSKGTIDTEEAKESFVGFEQPSTKDSKCTVTKDEKKDSVASPPSTDVKIECPSDEKEASTKTE